jgi:hypothetical protein
MSRKLDDTDVRHRMAGDVPFKYVDDENDWWRKGTPAEGRDYAAMHAQANDLEAGRPSRMASGDVVPYFDSEGYATWKTGTPKRDAGIFADRTAALDNLVAREPVRRINSTYTSEHPTRPSETIFDGCYSIWRP